MCEIAFTVSLASELVCKPKQILRLAVRLRPSTNCCLPRRQATACRLLPSSARLGVISRRSHRSAPLRICHYLTQACQSMVAVDDRVLVQTVVIDRMVLGCPMLNSMHWPVPHLTVLAAIPGGYWAWTVHACGTCLLDTVRDCATPRTVCTHRVQESFSSGRERGRAVFYRLVRSLAEVECYLLGTRPHRNGKGTDCHAACWSASHSIQPRVRHTMSVYMQSHHHVNICLSQTPF